MSRAARLAHIGAHVVEGTEGSRRAPYHVQWDNDDEQMHFVTGKELDKWIDSERPMRTPRNKWRG